jgi:hypothetical protein
MLTIRDEDEPAKGYGVEFYWQTRLPVGKTENGVRVRGDKGIATLFVPPGCTVRLDRLPLAEGAEHTRIAIHEEATRGTLVAAVRLRPASEQAVGGHTTRR